MNHSHSRRGRSLALISLNASAVAFDLLKAVILFFGWLSGFFGSRCKRYCAIIPDTIKVDIIVIKPSWK